MRRIRERRCGAVSVLALVVAFGMMCQASGCGVASSRPMSSCTPHELDEDALYKLIEIPGDVSSSGFAWSRIALGDVDELDSNDRRLVTADPFVTRPVNLEEDAPEFIDVVAEQVLEVPPTRIPWLLDPGKLFYYWADDLVEGAGDVEDGHVESDDAGWVIVFARDLSKPEEPVQCTLVDANGDLAVDAVYGSDADGDGVRGGHDVCPNTPSGAPIDSSGCSTNDYLSEITSGFANTLISGWVTDQVGVSGSSLF
ncbi:MAG: hypothetical protein GY842_20680 [bacterium]|nr:hypothetical protein [bacterium]